MSKDTAPVSARSYTCKQIGCKLPASHAMRWPGKPLHDPICAKHTSKALGVSGAMGFTLEQELLEDVAAKNRAEDARETARAFFVVGMILERLEAAQSPDELDQVVAALTDATELVRRVAAFRREAIL